MAYMTLKNDDDCKLISLELYSEMINDMGDVEYYLKAVYEHTTKYRKERLTIPKIHLGVNPHNVIINHAICHNYGASVNIGFGNLPIIEKDKTAYIVEVLEEYPQKMTMEELEKKLGHKVEIVSKK